MNVEKSNKLIAEFMGEKKYSYSWLKGCLLGIDPKIKFIKHGYQYFSIDKLKYHSSWDWLMPVVEKIGNITYSDFEAREKLLNISPHITRYEDYFYICPDKIEDVYKAVIEFIKWYNKNK